jgi:hypothetical protein
MFSALAAFEELVPSVFPALTVTNKNRDERGRSQAVPPIENTW